MSRPRVRLPKASSGHCVQVYSVGMIAHHAQVTQRDTRGRIRTDGATGFRSQKTYSAPMVVLYVPRRVIGVPWIQSRDRNIVGGIRSAQGNPGTHVPHDRVIEETVS